ncbi:MAG: hypothetical protein ACR2RV_09590 [Verrucomicrobiales bacterium]
MSQNEPATPRKSGKFRWFLWIPLAIALLLGVLVISAGKIANSYITPDFITSTIESEHNCRAEVAETKISLFSFPAKVEILGVKIGARDEHADAGTKLADRPALGVGAINADSISLEANLLDLIRRRISVEHLTVDNLYVAEFLIEREGGNSLDPLFDPPTTVRGQPNPEFEEKKQRRELAKQRRKMAKAERPEQEERPFTISELPLPATMSALNINNAQVNAKIRRNKTRITFSDIQIKVSDIDVAPGDLGRHNRAKVTVTAHLDIEDRDRTVKFADLDIRSEGEVIPFDPVTGYINPDITHQITVLKGGKLDAIPSLVKLAGKIKKLDEIGLRLDVLAESITLERDSTVTLGYRDGTLEIVEPAQIDFNGHLLTVNKGAWLETGSNRHEASAEILLSAVASDQALGNARDFLREKAKQFSFDQDTVLKYSMKLLEPVTKNGQVWVPFTSSGDFNDPKVRPDVDLQNLAETIALEALGDILEKTQEDAGKSR